jgi:hypothetical protein
MEYSLCIHILISNISLNNLNCRLFSLSRHIIYLLLKMDCPKFRFYIGSMFVSFNILAIYLDYCNSIMDLFHYRLYSSNSIIIRTWTLALYFGPIKNKGLCYVWYVVVLTKKYLMTSTKIIKYLMTYLNYIVSLYC